MTLSRDISGLELKYTPPIRQAVAYIIRGLGGHEGQRYSFGDFVSPINKIADTSGRDDMVAFNEKNITTAFGNSGIHEYALECNNIHDDLSGVLHVRVGLQVGPKKHRYRVYDICWVKDMHDAEIAADNAKANNHNTPVSTSSTTSRFSRSSDDKITLPDHVISGLIEFATDAKDKLEEKKRKRISTGAGRQKQKEKKHNKASARKAKKNPKESDDEDDATTTPISTLRMQYAEKLELLRKAENACMEKKEELKSARGHYQLAQEECIIIQQHLRRTSSMEDDEIDKTIQTGIEDDNNDDGDDEVVETKHRINYLYRGRIGLLELRESTGYGFTEADLLNGMLPDDEDNIVEDNKDDDGDGDDGTAVDDGTNLTTTLTKTPHNLVQEPVGTQSCWVPKTHKLIRKNVLTQLRANDKCMKALIDLFSKAKCTWDTKARQIFTSFSSFGYGCSDEATAFIMTGTLLAVFGQVGIDISGEQVAKTIPSRATLSNWEVATAVDCLFGECGEMKDAGVTRLGITTDHGHRKGQDHLVKLLSYPTKKDDGSLTISHLCLNVDSAGHSADEASDAIAKSVSFYTDILKEQNDGKEVKLSVITGDSGGGASVQQLHPKLITNKTMCKYSKRLACDLHNMNKALEVACVETWGKQGIGHRTPYQMYWLWNKIFKLSREQMGRQGVNEAWHTTIDNLRGRRNWQTTAINKCRHAFEDFMKRLQELEEGDDDDLDLAIQMITKAPTDVKDPVFSRWESVTPSIRLFADYWIVIYFFARTVAQMEKAGSYLKTLSCALLSLMHNSSMPTNDGDNIAAFIKQHEGDDSVLSKEPLSEDATPIFLVVTHFLDGFNTWYYHGKPVIDLCFV
jgi:hypothetical protein